MVSKLIQSLQFSLSDLKFEKLLRTMILRLQEQSLGFGMVTVWQSAEIGSAIAPLRMSDQ